MTRKSVSRILRRTEMLSALGFGRMGSTLAVFVTVLSVLRRLTKIDLAMVVKSTCLVLLLC